MDFGASNSGADGQLIMKAFDRKQSLHPVILSWNRALMKSSRFKKGGSRRNQKMVRHVFRRPVGGLLSESQLDINIAGVAGVNGQAFGQLLQALGDHPVAGLKTAGYQPGVA